MTKISRPLAELCNMSDAHIEISKTLLAAKQQLINVEEERKNSFIRLKSICWHPAVAIVVDTHSEIICLVCGHVWVENNRYKAPSHELTVYVISQQVALNMVQSEAVNDYLANQYAPFTKYKNILEDLAAQSKILFGIS